MIRRAFCLFAIALFGSLLAAPPLAAQTLPSNSSLTGSYNVRYLANDGSTYYDSYSFQGTLTFDGNGNYTLVGSEYDNYSGTGASHTLNTSGTYKLLSSGMFTMDNPIGKLYSSDFSGTTLYGGVGQGNIIVASSTEDYLYDVMVAFPASTSASNSALNGQYWVASMDTSGDLKQVRNTFFSLNADGKGGLGAVTVNGTALNLNNAATTQTITGASYTVTSNGSGTLTLGGSGQLLSGNKTLYVSPDGNLFIAGDPNGYDLIIGVKALSGSAGANTLTGLYYTAGVEYDASNATATQAGDLYATTGSLNSSGQGTAIAHDRTNCDYNFCPFDFTYTLPYSIGTNGTIISSTNQYAFGAGGNLVLLSGASSNYQIELAVRAPSLSGSGVFLNPTAVVNAASFAPVTNPIAPGEMISLFGSGFTGGGQGVVASALPLPTTLNGVQVMINNTPAPLFYVSSGQINAQVPFSTPSSGQLVSIQVMNNGTASNTVQMYTNTEAPGIFSQTQSGYGSAIVTHADNSLVTTAKPAHLGETVVIYATGLGAVTPAVNSGAAGVASKTTSTVSVYFGQSQNAATLNYSGLAPGFAGLYQINAVIPSDAGTGNTQNLEILTNAADNLSVTIPISK